jgi:hypothetical protein
VAQARRRRRTKHRGNAAGVVEARGRTGRKPTAAEKSAKGAEAARARDKRLSRFDRPPTWSGALKRSSLFAVILFGIALIGLKAGALQAIVYFAFALLAYTPISYYTDAWMYRRQQRKKSAARRGKAATR